MTKKGVLLVNLGTPDSPETGDVRKYLREFLMDGRVIDIPLIFRWLLVNLIIAPFRAPKSAKVYKKVWTKEGSPLKVYTLELEKLVQNAMGENFVVKAAMRYQSPSISSKLKEILQNQVDSIHVIPLFPQYASASSGSVMEKVMEELSKLQTIPQVKILDQFCNNEAFIQTFYEIGNHYWKTGNYEHVLFTYHGLPERHIRKGDDAKVCVFGTCCDTLTSKNRLCYRAQCFETSRKLAEKLNLSKEQYTVSFQSRLGRDPWIQPYTQDVVAGFGKKGLKKVLTFSPSFVADCLETIEEIGEEYQEVFEKAGGEKLQLVESLNLHPGWVNALKQMILKD